jgi:hypothetical protein
MLATGLLVGVPCSPIEFSVARALLTNPLASEAGAIESRTSAAIDSPLDSSTLMSEAIPNSQSAMSFDLEDYQWRNRVLLVFAPSEQHPNYQQQMQQFVAQTDEFTDRDLLLVQVLASGQSRLNGEPLDPASADRLRQQFGVQSDEFRVILIGKDGTVKRSETSPVAVSSVFTQIDAMPMRQQEMQQRNQL